MHKNTILQSNIINLLQLERLPLPQKQEIIDKATDLTSQRVIKRLFDQLKKKDEKELKKIEDKEESQIWEFLFSKFSNIEEIIREEILKVKEELIDIADQTFFFKHTDND